MCKHSSVPDRDIPNKMGPKEQFEAPKEAGNNKTSY